MRIKPAIQAFDRVWGDRVHALPSSLDPLFFTLTNIGEPVVTLALGALVIGRGAWVHDMELVWAGAVVFVTLIIGSAIKELIRRVRPLNPHPKHKLWLDTYSFPSGHASGSMIAYGLMSYFAWMLLPAPWNLVGALVCMALPFGIGLSRVYLRVHFPSDVVGGWLLGLVMLGVIIFAIQPLA